MPATLKTKIHPCFIGPFEVVAKKAPAGPAGQPDHEAQSAFTGSPRRDGQGPANTAPSVQEQSLDRRDYEGDPNSDRDADLSSDRNADPKDERNTDPRLMMTPISRIVTITIPVRITVTIAGPTLAIVHRRHPGDSEHLRFHVREGRKTAMCLRTVELIDQHGQELLGPTESRVPV
ncbi:unnamed protein product [Phytophthora fragariaefolia]|uniref:Unnamed protein product n=1 Tax=Phytophthora fragariaefolia TaxID=1490495 RepID=A0A9W6Y609_9STRA|nr:unnamed protein product [Phytophthora fragariaefolia]